MQTEVSADVFRFGGLTLDLRAGVLIGGGGSTVLRPKPHALLSHLAKNRGRVVPKSELLDVVWPGVFVTEDSLTQAVKEVRKIIGEDQIRTVPKRGYMLISEIEDALEATGQPTVAVLRFLNESGIAADLPIVDGFAEDIINGLTRFKTVTVLARNSTFFFTSHEPTQLPQIRASIGASYLVEGSVWLHSDRVRVAVNLVDARDGRQLWGDRYWIDSSSLHSAQHVITEEIVSRLIVRVGNEGFERTSLKPLKNLASYELVLRGVALLRDPAQTDLEQATNLFERALEKDSNYGLAYTYLALTKTLASEFAPSRVENLVNARQLADKGAALSPDQATCRRVQSLVRTFLHEHHAAELQLRLALELNPFDADSIGQMGFLQVMRGRPIDALVWLERAVRINPMQPQWCNFDRSLALYMLGDYSAAADCLNLATRPTPWIKTRLAACLAQLGRIDEAQEQIASALNELPSLLPLDYALHGIPLEHMADREHLADGVRLATAL